MRKESENWNVLHELSVIDETTFDTSFEKLFVIKIKSKVHYYSFLSGWRFLKLSELFSLKALCQKH